MATGADDTLWTAGLADGAGVTGPAVTSLGEPEITAGEVIYPLFVSLPSIRQFLSLHNLIMNKFRPRLKINNRLFDPQAPQVAISPALHSLVDDVKPPPLSHTDGGKPQPPSSSLTYDLW